MIARTSRRLDLVALTILIAALALYLWTLDDGLQPEELRGGDLITHQYAQVQARPSNAPGYPLYTMGGWLWFRMWRLLLGPESHPIRILSSYSTIWALAALWLLYRLLKEVAAERSTEAVPALPALLTIFYAVTYFFWYYATTTEQYASAVAQTLLMIWLAFRWEAARDRGEPSDRWLLWLAFLTGVGLAHLVTVLFIVPPLLWFVLSRQPGLLRRPRLIGKAVLLACIPLISYVYVYMRGAQHPEWWGAGEWRSTWHWFWSFLSTRQGRDELTWSLFPLWTDEFPAIIWRELTWPILLAGLWGISRLGRRRAILLYASLVIYFVFCFIDRLGNWYQVIMPAYPLILVGVAALSADLWRWRGARPWLRADLLVALALIALIVYRFDASYARADSSGRPEDTGLDPGWAILAEDPPQGSVILGTRDQLLALEYLTEIWGVRRDLRPMGTEQARRALEAEGSILATVDAVPIVLEEISPDVRFTSSGIGLVQVRRDPTWDLPEDVRRVDVDAGDGILLAGIRLWRPRPVASLPEAFQPGWRLSLYWRAAAQPTQAWAVSVRPMREGSWLTSEGQPVQYDRAHPVQGAYPTTQWLPGEVVRDDYPWPGPSDAPPDAVMIILYRTLPEGGFENLAEITLTLTE
ncbi:MAG: hypothetical protein Kow0047_01720 [Anaerolineae bacterium]